MVVFYVIGGLTAIWAVVLAALGITRHNFPASGGAMTAVIAVSALLVAGSIGSAVIGGALEAEEHEAEAAEEEAAGEEAAGGEAAPAGGQELELAADPTGELAFDREQLQAEAGSVALVMENPAPIEHNVSIENGVQEEGEVVGEGGTSTVSAELDPGRYAFYCSVPGHREGGMEGTLRVE